MLQAGFQRAPDGDPAVAVDRRLDGRAGDQRREHVRPVGGGQFKPGFGIDERAQEAGKAFAVVAGIEFLDAARLVARQLLGGANRRTRHLAELDRLASTERRQRRDGRRERGKQVTRGVDIRHGEARQPERFAIRGMFGEAPLEILGEPRDVRSPGAAAQRHQLDRFGCGTYLAALAAEPQQRVLQQGEKRHRVARPEHRFSKHGHQHGRRRAGQRRAAGIVGADAEAPEFRRHAARQLAVGGDQRGAALAVRHGAAQCDGDSERLVVLVACLDQAHPFERARVGELFG